MVCEETPTSVPALLWEKLASSAGHRLADGVRRMPWAKMPWSDVEACDLTEAMACRFGSHCTATLHSEGSESPRESARLASRCFTLRLMAV